MAFSRKRTPANRLDAELIELEQRAETVVVPGADAPFFNAAGDLCLEAGLRDRALEYYGRAIDAYLNAERWEAAAAICRKILRISPEAVRARCTLAWLAIGKGFVAEATEHLSDYVEAARRAGRTEYAANQLRRMGEVSDNGSLRLVLAEQLLTLGADRASDYLFGTVYQERNRGGARDDEHPQNWNLIRRAALLGPRELRGGDSLAVSGALLS